MCNRELVVAVYGDDRVPKERNRGVRLAWIVPSIGHPVGTGVA
jgi:hypothetical protein